MCGLTGFFTRSPRAGSREMARVMNEAIRHRGPDGHGIWQSDDGMVTLAHRRLAIVDLSPAGAQPMASASGRYTLVYNGEIYNFQSLRDELERAGAHFRGRSDTEVFLTAVETWGLNAAVQKINGMFAIVLWDEKTRHLHFIRDRLGKKPLYVGWAGGALVFGSELKALRAHPDFKPRVHKAALAAYMRYGFVPAPLCIYEDVWTLPAGHRLDIDTERLRAGQDVSQAMQPYWSAARVADDARRQGYHEDEHSALERFEDLLSTCVKERMVSDVPLGAFLSGGIDSSAVVALMQAHASKPVKTYTIGFHEAGFDEAQHAARVARHLGTDHHELYLDALSALSMTARLPEMYDEPFADISAIPTALVSEFTRRDVTVALSGDGGDEILGGYNRHVRGQAVYARMRWVPPALRGMIARGLRAVPAARWDALMPGQPQAGSAVHKAAGMLALDGYDAIYKQLLSQNDDGIVLHRVQSVLQFEKADAQVGGLGFSEAMMLRDALFYLPHDILAKVDRASMACGLEVRAPLLDPRMYEFCWRLPLHYKIRDGQGKWLLRALLKRTMPPTLFERPKQGFSMPVGEWLRGALRPWAESLLDEHRIRQQGLLDAQAVSRLWQAHLAGRGNHAGALWTILMFQAWQQRWL